MVSSIIYAIAILVTAIMFYSLDLFVFKEGTEKSQDLSEVKQNALSYLYKIILKVIILVL